jgi:hypothetical protein
MELKDDSGAVLQWSMIILVPRSLKLEFARKWSCGSLVTSWSLGARGHF